MNVAQIIDALPPLVYMRRGELVIQFSGAADLVGRLAELNSALSQLDQETARAGDGRGRGRPISRPSGASPTRGQSDAEPGGSVADLSADDRPSA